MLDAHRLKSLGKVILAGAATRLPWGVREALFQAICDRRGRNVTFAGMAAEFHVVAIKVDGDYGVIQGSPSDVSVLGTYAETGRWADRTNEQITQFFAERGAGMYIDVGANIGLTTIPIAQNPEISCIAIEPEPNNFQNLVVNVAANCPHGNVETKRLAVFSRRSSVKFEIATGNMGDHRIRLKNEPGLLGEHQRPTIDVEAVPLDEIVPTIKSPLAIKIDTQGAEPFVIEGGMKTLSGAQLLIVEFCPYMISRMNGDPSVVAELLRAQFTTASLAWKESGQVPEQRPVADVVAELREIASLKKNDAYYYVDIIARK